jgi:membrane fusion protein, adhesin transport system
VEGQQVAAGAPLVTFDPELVRAELAELTGRWQVKSAEVARLRAEATGSAFIVGPELAAGRPDLMRDQEELLTSRRESQASRTEALAQAIERRAREAESLTAELRRLRNSHALVSQQLEAVKGLAEKGLYPRLRLVSVERALSDVAGDASRTRAQLEAAEAALAEAKSRREALDREWRAQVLGELADASAERDRLADTLRRQEALVRNLVVRAPVEGIVQELAVTTPGQSVGSNQPLMKLVPTGGNLVIEAWVANRDMAYLRPGQPAKVKVLAYDFLRFGTLSGRVERIAADAAPDPETGALTYEIEVVTEQAELGTGAERFRVVPGMAVEVDLLAGERTILSYLTDRIFRKREAAFREG